MISYYLRNKEKCKKKALERYYRIKDDAKYIESRRIYFNGYYGKHKERIKENYNKRCNKTVQYKETVALFDGVFERCEKKEVTLEFV